MMRGSAQNTTEHNKSQPVSWCVRMKGKLIQTNLITYNQGF